MSPARRCSLMSGWRRTMPVAEHGASRGCDRTDGHPTMFRAASHRRAPRSRCSPRRFRFSRMRADACVVKIERDRSSSARSSICAALPPGAAQASRTRCPSARSSTSATRCAAPSCTEKRPFRITGKTRHVGAAFEHDRIREHRRALPRRCPSASRRSSSAVSIAAATVDAQRQRRFVVVRGEDRVGIVRPVAAQRVDQPARMRRARDFVGIKPRVERRALAHEAAQQSIDESAVARLAELARRIDARGDDGVVRHLEHADLRAADGEQRMHVARLGRQRLFQQRGDRGVQTQPPARRRRTTIADSNARSRESAMRGVAAASVARSEAPSNTMRTSARAASARSAAPATHRVAPGSRRALCQSRTLILRPPARCTSKNAQHAVAGRDVERIAARCRRSCPAGVSRCHRSRVRTRCARRSPSISASATGHGSNARTLRASAAAGSFQSSRASCLVDLVRVDDAALRPAAARSALRRARYARALRRARRRRASRDDRAASRRFRPLQSACGARAESGRYRGRLPSA